MHSYPSIRAANSIQVYEIYLLNSAGSIHPQGSARMLSVRRRITELMSCQQIFSQDTRNHSVKAVNPATMLVVLVFNCCDKILYYQVDTFDLWTEMATKWPLDPKIPVHSNPLRLLVAILVAMCT